MSISGQHNNESFMLLEYDTIMKNDDSIVLIFKEYFVNILEHTTRIIPDSLFFLEILINWKD